MLQGATYTQGTTILRVSEAFAGSEHTLSFADTRLVMSIAVKLQGRGLATVNSSLQHQFEGSEPKPYVLHAG